MATFYILCVSRNNLNLSVPEKTITFFFHMFFKQQKTHKNKNMISNWNLSKLCSLVGKSFQDEIISVSFQQWKSDLNFKKMSLFSSLYNNFKLNLTHLFTLIKYNAISHDFFFFTNSRRELRISEENAREFQDLCYVYGFLFT